MMRGLRRILLVMPLAVASFTATPALAAPGAPGWSINSVADPAHFGAAETQDEVQVFSIHATGGEYELYAGFIGPAFATAPIKWDASAAEVQSALEAVPQLQASGNVTVTGGPGDASGSKPYKVTWAGAWSGNSPGRLYEAAGSTLTGGAPSSELVQEEAQDVAGRAFDRYTISVTNSGSAPSTGPVSVIEKLPAQLARALPPPPASPKVGLLGSLIEERPSRQTGECTLTDPVTIRCEYDEPEHPVRPDDKLVVTLYVAVPSPSLTGTLLSEATVEGGGAPAARSTIETVPVNMGPAPFGIEQLAFESADLAGEPDLQAGDHPYGVMTTLAFNSLYTGLPGGAGYHASEEVKDLATYLPLGFLGDPLATERCPEVKMTQQTGPTESGITACPPGSIVGAIWLTTGGEEHPVGPFPLYNILPARGYPAELSFNYAGFGQPSFLYASVVRGGSGYQLRVATPGVPRARGLNINRVALTIFGDPSAHDGGSDHAAFVTNPTACSSEPLRMHLDVTSWEGKADSREATAYPQIVGCNLLQGAFSPGLKLAPEGVEGLKPEEAHVDTPSGYEVELKVPQAAQIFGQLATPTLDNATVTLPAGVSLSPSAASGPNALAGCKAEGPEGMNIGSPSVAPDGQDLGDPQATEIGEGHPGGNGSPYDDGMWHAAPGHCPARSQIGNVEVKTPLLDEPLKGHVYVAEPKCSGDLCEGAAERGEVFGVYLEMAGSGVIIKLKGSVEVGGYGHRNGLAPGQLRARFDGNLQLPFEDFEITLYGGQRAALASPQTCGTFTSASDLEPWSAPESGPNATPSWPFTVGGCTSPTPFNPGFEAGSQSVLAKGFSQFTLTLTRKDGEQDLRAASVVLPPGVAGMISKVPLCDEADANAGACPEASRIGTAHVSAGAGSEPLWLKGRVYLTGAYRGEPFGLSIVVPAVAGPFDLGREVVRAAIGVDSRTAQVSVTSDPIPLLRDGLSLRLKEINVAIDRPEFIFNPTNCSQSQVTGSVSGALADGPPGTTVSVSTPFAVAGCRYLPFKPAFSALTHALHTRANGAYLHVVVRSSLAQANIRRVKVSLPKQLPSRLATLKLACTERQFAANPAGCPKGSFVGTASARTPVLPVPLTGPAVFVSHGGAAFPDLDLVLQGDGVTVTLTGSTFIGKAGITTSTFATVPDVPVTRFDLVLPTGPHSALAGIGDFCSHGVTVRRRVKTRVRGRVVHRVRRIRRRVPRRLLMPTTITGQNGAVVMQKTSVAVQGCGAHRPRAR